MVSTSYIARLLLLVLLAQSSGCARGDNDMLEDRNKTKAEEVSNLIASELEVGAGAQAIEAFFERHEIVFSYNRFDHRYQAIIRDVAEGPLVDQAIVIHVYVDHQRRFVRFEVKDSFTGP